MDEINFPYIDFYYSDWRMGCSGMTAQQEGLYMRLFCHLGTANGRGLPNDFNFIYRMVADPSDDAELVQQQKEDLMWVITHKLTLIEGRYHQLVQKKRREDKVEIVKIRQESGKKGGLAKAKQKSSKVSDSDSDSIFNNIWDKLTYKRGSKQVAKASFWKIPEDIKSETIIKKYNELCSSIDDPKFVPHFATWINQARWEEELPVKNEDEYSGIRLRKDDDYKKWVPWVKKGRRHLSISDDMVLKMKKENLITDEEHKRW